MFLHKSYFFVVWCDLLLLFLYLKFLNILWRKNAAYNTPIGTCTHPDWCAICHKYKLMRMAQLLPSHCMYFEKINLTWQYLSKRLFVTFPEWFDEGLDFLGDPATVERRPIRRDTPPWSRHLNDWHLVSTSVLHFTQIHVFYTNSCLWYKICHLRSHPSLQNWNRTNFSGFYRSGQVLCKSESESGRSTLSGKTYTGYGNKKNSDIKTFFVLV